MITELARDAVAFLNASVFFQAILTFFVLFVIFNYSRWSAGRRMKALDQSDWYPLQSYDIIGEEAKQKALRLLLFGSGVVLPLLVLGEFYPPLVDAPLADVAIIVVVIVSVDYFIAGCCDGLARVVADMH